ncbi:MAG: hypothetical protein ACYC9Q_14215 [Bacillota bacterium]
MPNIGHNAELKLKALTIAETAGIPEASRATGVPAGTIKRWRFENRAKNPNRTERAEPTRASQKLEALQAEAVERAVDEAGQYITQRLKGLADSLYTLAEKAVKKVDVAICDKDELPEGKTAEVHDRDGAAWLRGIVGVLAQAIDKAQLLSGRPTARPEMTERHVYEITQRIITDHPEIINEIFPADPQPRLEDRSGESSPAGVGLVHRPDIPPS